jgi:hypothetical protein
VSGCRHPGGAGLPRSGRADRVQVERHTLAERPAPGRRGLMASGASPAGRRQDFPERRGPGRVALAAGGQPDPGRRAGGPTRRRQRPPRDQASCHLGRRSSTLFAGVWTTGGDEVLPHQEAVRSPDSSSNHQQDASSDGPSPVSNGFADRQPCLSNELAHGYLPPTLGPISSRLHRSGTSPTPT